MTTSFSGRRSHARTELSERGVNVRLKCGGTMRIRIDKIREAHT